MLCPHLLVYSISKPASPNYIQKPPQHELWHLLLGLLRYFTIFLASLARFASQSSRSFFET